MDAPKRYRKLPVVIEAMRFDAPSGPAIERWSKGKAQFIEALPGPHGHEARMKVKTREGTIYAVPGDWIIRGVHGEYYPIGGDIFRETYEEVSE